MLGLFQLLVAKYLGLSQAILEGHYLALFRQAETGKTFVVKELICECDYRKILTSHNNVIYVNIFWTHLAFSKI